MKLISKVVAFILLIILSPIFLLIAVLIKVNSNGPVLFWSKRVGRNSEFFLMPKFRTMHVGSPIVATDLLLNSRLHITQIGRLLRNSSLDELPQLYSILRGEMDFVGPRPALYSQLELINARKKYHIDQLNPGITGYAQIIVRDNVTTEEKVSLDRYYLLNKSLKLDMYIILKTILVVFSQRNIKH
jgi:O-antigen biosynthesis protein WbqP